MVGVEVGVAVAVGLVVRLAFEVMVAVRDMAGGVVDVWTKVVVVVVFTVEINLILKKAYYY